MGKMGRAGRVSAIRRDLKDDRCSGADYTPSLEVCQLTNYKVCINSLLGRMAVLC